MNTNSSTMEAPAGFRDPMVPAGTLTIASNQWASRPQDERFQTLDALYESVSKRRTASREETISTHDVSLEAFEDGLQVMIGNQEPAAPTNWSFGQMANAANFRASELRKLNAETAATVLNEMLGKNKHQEIKVMRTLGDESDTLQAVTGPNYGRIFDAEVVEMVQGIVEMSGGAFYNPKAYDRGAFGAEPVPSGLYASDRDVFMFMIDGGSIFDEGERAQFNRGFIVTNSEVGKSSLLMMSFFFNQVCGNHYIFGAANLNMKRIIHSSGAPGRFASNAFDELKLFAQQKADMRPVQRALEVKLIDIRPGGHDYHTERDKWIRAFAEANNFSMGEVRNAIACSVIEEGRCDTAFDLVQGFTASARTIPHVDSRIDLERRAGAWMTKLV